ncbi:MAG TPA: LamG-like jellyroll fold domain-containing protein [Verrucomicrobiae bacterium]|jgi:autotransporter-associated beta strand protein|nr:LamG-like jellyroll fold domain-containing protein [Verrucomicrobiae bacterium]
MKKERSARFLDRRILGALAVALIGVSAARADYQSTVLADSPIAYYPLNLNVDTGSTASDVSGNNNPGTLVNIGAGFNDATGPSAFITNAISFDGLSQYVDLGDPDLFNFSGPITLEAWVQPVTAAVFGDIIAKGYDSANNNYELTLRANGNNGGSTYFGGSYGPAGTQGATGGTQSTSWSHVVLTHDGSKWSLYVNGALVQQNSDSVGSINFADPWRIGTGSADGASRLFTGNITQVAMYNYALTANQVNTHYFFGQYGTTPGNSVPIITQQPTNQSAYAGGTVQFKVGILSALPTTNLWFKGATPLPSQTNATLTLFNVSAADVANYSVVIGNSNGTTNSAVASFSLLTPPTPTVGPSLVWNTNNSGVWDNGGTANWRILGTSTTSVFNDNDTVLFDDTVGVPTAVTLNDTVSPSYITNNSSANNFTISGSGDITGAASIVKLGSSTLEISTPNDFGGGVSILGGTVQMDQPISGSKTSLGAESAAPIAVTNGATLAINTTSGNSGLDLRQAVISGDGVGGNGALRPVGSDIYHDGNPRGGLFRSLRLAGNATIGNSALRWDLGDDGLLTVISSSGSNYSLTCLERDYSEWHQVTIDPALGNMDYLVSSPNSWVILGMGSSLGNPTNVLTLHSGVSMDIRHGANNDDSGYGKIIHVLSGAQFIYRPGGGQGDYHLKTSLQLDAGTTMAFYNGNGGNETGTEIGGTVTFNGLAHISIGDSPITFTNVLSGPGGFYWDSYNHPLIFTANNTYTGPSIIGDGLSLTLTGNGAISQSLLIYFGGTDGVSERLNVSGRSDGTLTLPAGQTLAGIGLVTGNLVVSPNATLSPGGTNSAIGSTNLTGTITADGDATLNGTTIIKLNGPGVSDTVQASGAINFGGTLNLANVSGVPLAAGNTFPIFSAGSYSGSFTAGITPTTPGSGLVWDTTQLLISGTISVKAAAAQPMLSGPFISGTNFIFSGSNGPANQNFVVLTSTNLATPLANWVPVLTNSFDNNGNFNATNVINAAAGRGFYLLQVQ